jgi:hypothetical protein
MVVHAAGESGFLRGGKVVQNHAARDMVPQHLPVVQKAGDIGLATEELTVSLVEELIVVGNGEKI